MLGLLIGLIGLAIPFIIYVLQQRHEREQERRAARAAWAVQQRQMCLDLLEAVIGLRSMLFTFRSLHDDLASRIGMKEQLELPRQQMLSIDETVRRVRGKMDLEPNAKLQEAIDHWGDAAIAYQQVIARPMSSRWNPVRLYFGKSPRYEVHRLADAFDARTKELQAAVREYMANLEARTIPSHVLKFPTLPKLAWPLLPQRARHAGRAQGLANSRQ